GAPGTKRSCRPVSSTTTILLRAGRRHNPRALRRSHYFRLSPAASPWVPNTCEQQNTRAEFEDAFRAIDHNKDGKVDITELNRLMVATGFGLTNQELKEFFGFFDRDGSGKVDMVEFLDYMMDA
ncbi:unnamed protein product, partial [Ectocarpus sp. 13 AM-2016]